MCYVCKTPRKDGSSRGFYENLWHVHTIRNYCFKKSALIHPLKSIGCCPHRTRAENEMRCEWMNEVLRLCMKEDEGAIGEKRFYGFNNLARKKCDSGPDVHGGREAVRWFH